MSPTLIALGGGKKEYRGYILERVARRYRLVLLSPQEPTWERKLVDDHVPVVAGDDTGVLAAAAQVASREPVAGVVTYHEACVELAALVAHSLDLPGCGPAAARRCRDKLAAREALRDADVPSARFLLVDSVEEARKAAADIGYPVVVKPRGLTASFGVAKVTCADDLEAAFVRARSNTFPEPWSFQEGILVEEYLDGPELSVDCAVRDGRAEPVIFARKILGDPPFFEEVGHVVVPPELIGAEPDAVTSVVVAAHEALGIENAVTHTELRVTSDGPRLIEVNGRLGGDVIPLVAELASGLDLPAASADIAVGAAPDLSTARAGIAGVRFFYAHATGRVDSVGLAPGIGSPSWLHQVSWLVRPGEKIEPVPGRFHFARTGYALVTGDTVEACMDRMHTVNDAHQLRLTRGLS